MNKYIIIIIIILIESCGSSPTRPVYKGDPNMDGIPFEVSDIVLVSRRITQGYRVWAENGEFDDPMQEWAADLDCNGRVDMIDLNLFLEKLEG